MRRKLRFVLAAALCIPSFWGLGRPAQAQPAANPVAQPLPGAQACFDRARKLGFPATGQTEPYILRASFTARASSGAVETGTYTDIWMNDRKWRREAVLGQSHFIRTRNGKKRYRLNDGPDAALLQFVLTAMEPLPAADSIQDSSWTVTADALAGVPAIRVEHGKEDPDGTHDPKNFQAFWFDPTGQLVKTYLNTLQTLRSNFEAFNGVQVARQIEVVLAGRVGMRIAVTALEAAGKQDSAQFALKDHDWSPAFTTEAR